MHIAYLNHFLDDPAHYPHVEALFKRFLAKSASSVEVFKVYLGYIRYVDLLSARHPTPRSTLRSSGESSASVKLSNNVTSLHSQMQVKTRIVTRYGKSSSTISKPERYATFVRVLLLHVSCAARFAPGTSCPRWLLSYPRSHRGCRWLCTMIPLRSLARTLGPAARGIGLRLINQSEVRKTVVPILTCTNN